MGIFKKYVSVVVFCLCVISVAGRWASAAVIEADMVIYNGRILTADSPDPNNYRTAQAAAIYDGKFVAVGNNDEVMQYAGEKTKKIDLGGRTVIPGLVESHDHLYGYAQHFFPKDAPRPEQTDPPVSWTNKAEFLAQIHSLTLKHKPGDWIITSPRGGFGGMLPELMRGDVTLADLDKAAPNNPVQLIWAVSGEGLVNSLALKPLLERYPKIQGVHRDAKGNPTGRLSGVAEWVPSYELWPLMPPEELGPYYKMELEEVAAQGMTTFSSRVTPRDLAAYSWLSAGGELPVRLAYTQEITHTVAENAGGLVSRLVGLQGGSGKRMWGAGDDKVWLIGMGPGSIDFLAAMGAACVQKPYPREALNFPLWKYQFYGPYGLCRLTDPAYNDGDVLRAAAKYGWRISAYHVAGDKGFDQIMDLMEELSKTYPDIIERRWAVDHCAIVHEDQIKRAKKFNIQFSCGPMFLYGGEKGSVGASKILYGEKEAGDSMIPFRGLIDNGLRVVLELDQHAFHPFTAMQIVITRKDMDGKVWGPQQAINRQEALYAYTRWSSEYVLKENLLGSIEPNKAADFAVLNRDYLTVPEDEIGRIDSVLTVMGGKITYSQPEFASGHGLPVVGFQGDRSRWKRGTADDVRLFTPGG